MVEIESQCAILIQELHKSYIPFDFPNSREVIIAFYTMKTSESQLASIATSFSASGSRRTIRDCPLRREERANERIATMPSTAIFF